MRPGLIAAAAVCAALIASAPAGARKSSQPSTGLRGIEFGRPAPDFTYADGAGRHTLSDLGGKIVLIHFWASWCKPCIHEMPALDRVYQTYGDRVTLVTMNWHDPLDGQSFAAARGWTLPIADDPGERAAKAYAIEEVPTTLILLGDRSVSYVSIGEASWDELNAALERALTPVPRV